MTLNRHVIFWQLHQYLCKTKPSILCHRYTSIDDSVFIAKAIYFTFFSCPALASSFPSEEKWQQTILLLLVRIELTSVKVKPEQRVWTCQWLFTNTDVIKEYKPFLIEKENYPLKTLYCALQDFFSMQQIYLLYLHHHVTETIPHYHPKNPHPQNAPGHPVGWICKWIGKNFPSLHANDNEKLFQEIPFDSMKKQVHPFHLYHTSLNFLTCYSHVANYQPLQLHHQVYERMELMEGSWGKVQPYFLYRYCLQLQKK